MLGMSHDFYGCYACYREDNGDLVNCKKECSNYFSMYALKSQVGNPNECCTGFMDYGDHPHHWSNCSVREFESTYLSENWSECMPEGKILHFLV